MPKKRLIRSGIFGRKRYFGGIDTFAVLLEMRARRQFTTTLRIKDEKRRFIHEAKDFVVFSPPFNKYPDYYGKYEILEPIVTGGMAQVWKALHPDLRRFVAIKVLHADLKYMSPAMTTRFITEGQAVAQLDHPNIFNVYDLHIPDVTEEGRDPFLVMKYIEGPTLSKYIQGTSRASRFPTPQEIVELFASISLALDYAHKRVIIRRGVKPSNILLDTTNTEYNTMGEPILSDFGLVKIIGTQAST